MKHTDTRIKVTKSMFHHALLDILQEKPIDQISVKELVEAAELNRSTFYLHYSSPPGCAQGDRKPVCRGEAGEI